MARPLLDSTGAGTGARVGADTGTGAPRRRSVGVTILGIVGVVAVVAVLIARFRPAPSADAVWNDARVAFEARDFPRAQNLLETLARLRPLTPNDHLLRAQVLIGLGQDDAALADLAEIPDEHSQAAFARLEAGQIERRRDRFDAAEANLQAAIRLDPKQIKARRELIYIYGIELRRDDLDRMFRELAELTTLESQEVFLWSLSKGLSWDAAENSRTLRKVVDAEPTNRRARLSLAEALFDLNRFEEADAMLAPLPESDPEARAQRARNAEARGDLARVDALLADGPSDNLGLALLRGKQALAQGEAAEALRHYRIAYRLAPQVREAVQGLAQALRLNHDPDAPAILEQSRRLDVLQGLIGKVSVPANRRDKDLTRQLGDACAAVGRLAEARGWYSLLVAQDPLDTKSQAAINRLRRQEQALSGASAPPPRPVAPADPTPETRP